MDEKKQETWIQTQWRPLLAMAYIVIILFDFIIGPIFWTFAQAIFDGQVSVAWIPLTLDQGGLFHAGMSAILGITAFTRGSEKLELIRREGRGGRRRSDNETDE